MRTIFCVLSVIFSNLLVAQVAFLPGFFIDKIGNKKECYIKYNNPVDNPHSFEYKINSGDKENKLLDLNNVSIVSITGEAKYINATVLMDRHSDLINNIEYGKDLVLKKETHFLKYVVESDYNLFVYRENGLEKFFYSHNSNEIYQLGFKEFYLDGTLATSKNELYKKQLWDSVKCNFPDKKLIDNLKYRESSLEDYFIKINECKTGKKITKNEVRSGFSNVKICFSSNFLSLKNPEKEFQFGSKNFIFFTGQYEYVFPYFNYKWSLFVEPQYVRFSKIIPYNNLNNYVGYNNTNVEIDFKLFQIPLGITYKIYTHKNYSLFTSYSINILNATSTNYYTYGIDPKSRIALNELAIPNGTIAIGASLKRIEVMFSAQPSFKNSDYMLTKTSLGIRYTFFSNNRNKSKSGS